MCVCVLGRVPFSSFTDRKQIGYVPTFLQQMFDGENIFTAVEGREGKCMWCINHTGCGEKLREKTSTYMMFYYTGIYIYIFFLRWVFVNSI